MRSASSGSTTSHLLARQPDRGRVRGFRAPRRAEASCGRSARTSLRLCTRDVRHAACRDGPDARAVRGRAANPRPPISRLTEDGTTSWPPAFAGCLASAIASRLLRARAAAEPSATCSAHTGFAVSRWRRGCCPRSTCTATCAARGRFSREKSEIMTAYTWQP